MANECLVTKLKGVVDNDNLKKVGEVCFDVAGATSERPVSVRIIVTSGSITIRTTSGCSLTNSQGDDWGTSHTFNNGDCNCQVIGTGRVFVDNKYKHSYFSLQNNKASIDINEIMYSADQRNYQNTFWVILSNVGQATRTKVYGVLDDKNLNYGALGFTAISNANGISGTLDNYVKSGKCRTFACAALTSTVTLDLSSFEGQSQCDIIGLGDGTTGEIKWLADTKLTAALGTNGIYISRNITGSIEDFVTRAIANGKTTGTLKINSAEICIGITFQGVPVNTLAQVGHSNILFTWDSQGNITYTSN